MYKNYYFKSNNNVMFHITVLVNKLRTFLTVRYYVDRVTNVGNDQLALAAAGLQFICCRAAIVS